MPRVIAPVISRDDEYFWKGVAEDRLLARCCAECGRLQHPPTPMCPKCGSVAWDVRELAGAGFVYSWIVSQHPTQSEDAPRVVALIELDEGLRLVSNLAGIEPADVRNGMRVEVEFGEIDGVKLPRFRPVTGGLS
jgi:uncharacterized OB-fold protein